MSNQDVLLRLRLSGQYQVKRGVDDVKESVKDLGDEAQKTGTKVKKGAENTSKFGDLAGKASGKVVTFTKNAAKMGAVFGASVLGGAVAGGVKRLSAIEDAQAKLSGLGHSAGSVNKIMDNALGSVQGTAFGLDEAATTAAGTVAAGIKPGQELEKTLRLVADAATIGGTSMGEMGAIFNKVAATGKLQGEVLQQLGERGIPILQLLGKELGKTPAEIAEMSKKGEINFKMFAKAMDAGLGGAALKSGETTRGALANTRAAMSRFGAAIVGGFFSNVKGAANGLTGALDYLTERTGPAMESVSNAVGPLLGKAVGAIPGITAKLAPVAAAVVAFGGDLWQAASVAGPAILDIAQAFAPIVSAGIKAAFVAIVAAMKVLGPAAILVADALAVVGKFLKNNQDALQVLTAVVLGGVAGWKAYRLATIAMTGPAKAAALATKVWAGAQRLLNMVMRANPMGIAITAIAALIAGFTVAYKKSATFRGAINALWNAIKTGFSWVRKNWPTLLAILTGPIGIAVLAIVKNFDKIKSKASSIWKGIKSTFKRGAQILGNVFKAPINGFINVLRGIKIEVKAKKVLGETIVPGFRLAPFEGLNTLDTGGVATQSGLAIVGGTGPEIIQINQGDRVTNPRKANVRRTADPFTGGKLQRGDSGPRVVVLDLQWNKRQLARAFTDASELEAALS